MSFLYGWVSGALGGLGLDSNKRPREPDTDTGAASSQPPSPLGSPGRHRLFSSSADVEDGSTTTGGESSLAEEEPEDRGALQAQQVQVQVQSTQRMKMRRLTRVRRGTRKMKKKEKEEHDYYDVLVTFFTVILGVI